MRDFFEIRNGAGVGNGETAPDIEPGQFRELIKQNAGLTNPFFPVIRIDALAARMEGDPFEVQAPGFRMPQELRRILHMNAETVQFEPTGYVVVVNPHMDVAAGGVV